MLEENIIQVPKDFADPIKNKQTKKCTANIALILSNALIRREKLINSKKKNQ